MRVLNCFLLFIFSSLAFGDPAYRVAPNFPDPMVLKGRDGFYYAYATGPQGLPPNMVVSRSRDLASWEKPKEILPVKPRWAQTKDKFWAPHVIFRNNLYYLFYSVEPDSSKFEHMRLAVAKSTQPMGPFTDVGQPFKTGQAEENIDPMVFEDESSGKTYLYWSRDGVITVQQLDASLLKFAPDSEAQQVLFPGKKKYQKVVEGPFVVKKFQYYYLFYSGDDCCQNPRYAVMAARSKSPLGPFTKLSDQHSSDGIILRGNKQWQNPGHNSVLRANGQDWIIYHVIDSRHPRNPVTGEIHRVLRISPLNFKRGWPTADVIN